MYIFNYIKINNITDRHLYFFYKIIYISNYNFNFDKFSLNKLYLYNLYIIYFNHLNSFKYKLPIKIKLKNNYFLKKKKKVKTNLIVNFFNNFLTNFFNFLLKKKLYFCLKKVNKSTRKFKNMKIIKQLS